MLMTSGSHCLMIDIRRRRGLHGVEPFPAPDTFGPAPLTHPHLERVVAVPARIHAHDLRRTSRGPDNPTAKGLARPDHGRSTNVRIAKVRVERIFRARGILLCEAHARLRLVIHWRTARTRRASTCARPSAHRTGGRASGSPRRPAVIDCNRVGHLGHVAAVDEPGEEGEAVRTDRPCAPLTGGVEVAARPDGRGLEVTPPCPGSSAIACATPCMVAAASRQNATSEPWKNWRLEDRPAPRFFAVAMLILEFSPGNMSEPPPRRQAGRNAGSRWS
jgi:hypothetical protein